MRVLVVQNFAGSGLGQVATALAEAHAEIDLRKPYEGEPLPVDTAGYDAAVLLGGGQNALADDTHPYFPHLLRLSRGFTEADKAVLGICLGSQLLARAFGGENRIGGASEFGWCAVARGAQSDADPLLAGLPQRFHAFQWHDDTFTLPPGAVHLASSDKASSQAFRLGRATYGVQFHFEADRRLVRQWNADFAGWLAEHQPDWPARFPGEAERHGPAADAHGLMIARNWVGAI